MVRYEDLEEMCQTLGEKISEANEKIRTASGDITGGDLSYIDSLTHALKSIKTIMAMMDSEGHSYDSGYSYGGYSGRMYPTNYTRARGNNARRDSRGRYSRGYSRGDNDELVEQLRSLAEDAPDERTRQDIHKLVSRMENDTRA